MKGVSEMEIKKRKPTGRPAINDMTKQLVIRLYNEEDSMTCDEIAKACNISRASVFRIMNDERKRLEDAKKAKING